MNLGCYDCYHIFQWKLNTHKVYSVKLNNKYIDLLVRIV